MRDDANMINRDEGDAGDICNKSINVVHDFCFITFIALILVNKLSIFTSAAAPPQETALLEATNKISLTLKRT